MDPSTLSTKDIYKNFRGYPQKKIQENNESEIMQVVLEDARESYAPEIIVELTSETTKDLEGNVARILEWIKNWVDNNQNAPEEALSSQNHIEAER